jgi:uncharacterized glyoxalase superfamily protein PhnB
MPDGAPTGYHTITPRIFVTDPRAEITFLREAFGAEGEYDGDRPAELRIGDSLLMVGGTGARAATSSFFYLYVADTDATYARAIAAGATSIEPPADQRYGDRRAMVQDVSGTTWQIATVLAPR